MTYQKQIGDIGEKIAEEFLVEKGYQVLDRKFITRFGELDLVTLDNGCVVFIEVKARTSMTFGNPEDSITPVKIERLEKAGLLWMQAHPSVPDDWRIDAIAILLDSHQQPLEIRHFTNILL